MQRFSVRLMVTASAVALLALLFVTPLSIVRAVESGANLVPNPGFETEGSGGNPVSWNKGGYGANTRVYTYPAEGRTGKGAKVEITSYTSGDVKWFFNDAAIIGGDYYTFRDYYKSDVAHHVTVRYTYADGTLKYVDIGTPPASLIWRKFETTWKVPAGVEKMTAFHLINSVGYLVTDDYYLARKDIEGFSQGFVSLNFDDGWKSQYAKALPVLHDEGVKGTFFITTGHLGWSGYMTKSNVRRLSGRGHEIGAHTRTHPHLPTLGSIAMRREIVGSKTDLLAMGIPNVATFAYPFGEYNDEVVGITRSNFSAARSAGGIMGDAAQNKYIVKSVSLRTDISPKAVKNWIDTAKREKMWLILVFHRVDESGADVYTTSDEDLREIINYIQAQGVPIKTFKQGAALLNS